MSQFKTLVRSWILAILIAGFDIGMSATTANPQIDSDRKSVDLPPPPQIESVNSAFSNSTDSQPSPPQNIPAPPPLPSSNNIVTIPPPPPTPKYCYVGTWEVRDLSQYWLPLVQKFAQTKVSSNENNGKVQITFTKDGYSIFEARNFQQKYRPKSTSRTNKFNEFELVLKGRATADYTEKKGMKLSFSSPNYRWFSSQLNLGEDLNVTGDRLFNLYGREGQHNVSLPYDCLDRDTIVLKIPVPKSEKSIAVKLKRIY